MVYTVNDVGMWREQAVCFNFFQCLADGFLTKRTSDLLERIVLTIGRILDEVDI